MVPCPLPPRASSHGPAHAKIYHSWTYVFLLCCTLVLSYNQFSGSIPDSLPSLPSLRVLNLFGNQLSDESLCKNYTGPLIFRHDGDSVFSKPSPGPPTIKVPIIAISVVVPVLVVILLLAFFIWWQKRKPVQLVPIHVPTRDPGLDSASGSKKGHGYNLNKTENRQFTYKELEKFTDKFKKDIGQGGFRPVYYGRLEDNTDVAVKMCSESSSHGLDEFLAEVHSLTKVHHRNLVSLIGYCWEKDHLALVYEYMSQGNLFYHLRGTTKLEGSLRAAMCTASGVVLLEVAAGEPPIVPGHGYIVRRVKQKIATSDIGSIADL